MPEAEFNRVVAAGEASYPTLRDVPREAFPLFLSSRTWLHMLDGTLQAPFFPRHPNGAIMTNLGDERDLDGMNVEVCECVR
eukprot:352864-Chlamydomonas_euryale.AAC.8